MQYLRIIACFVVINNPVSPMTLGLQNPSEQICTYTFNVPREGESCFPGSQQNYINSLETLITNQHALLEQQLNVITDKLLQQEQSHDSNQMNNKSQPSNVDIGTTYVRWGRTTCPETAAAVYEGKTEQSMRTFICDVHVFFPTMRDLIIHMIINCHLHVS